MTAIRLRLLLSGVVIVLAILVIVSIWLAQSFLTEQVQQTDHAKIDAEIQEEELSKLQRLQSELQSKANVMERLKQIAANADDYQDRVISDLTVYAIKNGLGVASIDFEQIKTKTPNKTALTVNLRSPVLYAQFLAFIHQIEQNLTKMQITSIALAPNPKDPNQLLNPTIKLEVFLKK